MHETSSRKKMAYYQERPGKYGRRKLQCQKELPNLNVKQLPSRHVEVKNGAKDGLYLLRCRTRVAAVPDVHSVHFVVGLGNYHSAGFLASVISKSQRQL